MNDKLNISLIGCGKMGSAMLQGWLKADIISHAHILDPMDIDPAILEKHSDILSHHKEPSNFVTKDPGSDIYVIAVKPQIIDAACRSIVSIIQDQNLVLSIAAGKTISFFENQFGNNQSVIRAMPNTPAAIGKGITVLTANTQVTETQKKQAEQLLSMVGKVLWAEKEELLDAVTAVSGSGPAYVFLLIEAMTKAGVKAGLEPEISEQLARQTVIGSAALAEEETLPASTLRENVTSPGGTTQAALEVLMNGNAFENLMAEAIMAAKARCTELSD